MQTAYIDSSFLLSILFEDENYDLSIVQWNKIQYYVSSILLEIETRINIYKYCLVLNNDKNLYNAKYEELSELLENINRKNIDNEILLEIRNNDILKSLKSIDSIHLATANIFNKLIKDKILVCSYDKNMIRTSKHMGLKTIKEVL